MAEECVLSDIVTKFLLNTCRLRPQLTDHGLQAAMFCASLVSECPVTHGRPMEDAWYHDVRKIPLTTGSVAEFYIEPMLPLVSDIDVMFYPVFCLAIPQGHQPPTQLPAEFSNYVKVHEIVDSHLPGYVYLKLRYLLTKCVEDDKYNFLLVYDNEVYLLNRIAVRNNATIHGPALTSRSSSYLSVDAVPCVRCLLWPTQAADWPTRRRNYSWPDSATVDHVVNNGCDVVGVTHHQCRQDEWMSKYQWRLSFSRAEIVLLNSWMPVQQIAYHMLRFFMKTKQLIDSTDNSDRAAVNNYHIKTLMLWTSELKPRSWWTENLNLVKICVELLHILSVCLTDRYCPHYFINNCNLVNYCQKLGMVASDLMTLDEANLSVWFVHKYLEKCAQLCPNYVLHLFAHVSNISELQNAVLVITKFRLHTSLYDLWYRVQGVKFHLSMVCIQQELTVQSYVYMMELIKWNRSLGLSEYSSAFALLHVSYKILRNGFNDNLIDILLTILRQSNDAQHYSKQHHSVLYLNKAAKLMKVTTNKLMSATQLISVELCKVCLRRALRYKDLDSDSIYCLANVYLAVLCYITGQYQMAIDHCTFVTRSQDHSQCSSHVVQGELLPKIDDDIDTALGLVVFYQYVLSTTLNQQKLRQYVCEFTTEMLAYHLHCRLVSHKMLPGHRNVINEVYKRYAKYISESHQLFIGDVLVLTLRHLRFAFTESVSSEPVSGKRGRSAFSETDLNTSELVELLQQSAVEHLTTSRQLEEQQFSSMTTIVTTDFEALYAYKHGDYQRCLQLSTQNVHTLSYAAFTIDVLTPPELIPLLDDDIVSLTALMHIVNPCMEDIGKYCITQLTLSLYLMIQCQLQLRHKVTSPAWTLELIKVAQRTIPFDCTLDQLTLKLSACKTITHSLQFSR